MIDYHKMLLEFHKAFDFPHPDKPTLEGVNLPLRAKLIIEEAYEFLDAAGLEMGNPMMLTHDSVTHPVVHTGKAPDMVKMIDAICDLLYVVHGAAVCMGIDPAKFFKEVHRTNMAKLGPDGKPIYREDGKAIKPPGWQPPDLESILERTKKQARCARFVHPDEHNSGHGRKACLTYADGVGTCTLEEGHAGPHEEIPYECLPSSNN